MLTILLQGFVVGLSKIGYSGFINRRLIMQKCLIGSFWCWKVDGGHFHVLFNTPKSFVPVTGIKGCTEKGPQRPQMAV